MSVLSRAVLAAVLLFLLVPRRPALAQSPGPAPYRALVGAESDDQVDLIEFRPCAPGQAPPACGAKVVRVYQVGVLPAETEGPHGVVAAPDGKSFYVSMAHGRPYGALLKYDLDSGRLLGRADLGFFPATVDIDPTDSVVYAINFNFDDPDMKPSSVSVVDGATMQELARTSTCRMPHGSRLNPAHTRHYSGCMMNDLLVEVDARTLDVARLFGLAPGKEGPVALDALASASPPMAGMAGMDHGDHATLAPSNTCSPTWAQPSTDGTVVWVACNRSNDIAEVDVASWTLRRRIKTPAAPYNMAVAPNGMMAAITQKGPATITLWALPAFTLVAEIPGTRKVASGLTFTADGRYLFATLEGIGGQPGTVDIIDVATHAKAATVDTGKQAGGIAMLP